MLTKGSSGGVTQQEIADRIGVSRQLVSHALHGTRSSRISPQTRREIREEAAKMGYRHRNRTTHTIAYVVPLETQILAAESRFMVLVGIALRKAGYRLMLHDMANKDWNALHESINAKTVDGVIFSSWMGGDVRNILPKVPWLVAADDDGVHPNVDVVALDTMQSSELLATHLLDCGHERICLVSGSGGSGFHERAKAGVRVALDQAGLSASNLTAIEVASNTEINQPLLKCLRSALAPTALICVGAERVVASLCLLGQHGFRIPKDISVVSLMDSHFFETLAPSITTTTAFGPETAEAVVQRLLEKIEEPKSPSRQTLVPAQLIDRESVSRLS